MNLDATVAAVQILGRASCESAGSAPSSVWLFVHHAQRRLDAEVDAYFRTDDAPEDDEPKACPGTMQTEYLLCSGCFRRLDVDATECPSWHAVKPGAPITPPSVRCDECGWLSRTHHAGDRCPEVRS